MPAPPYLDDWAELSGSARLDDSAPKTSALITSLPWIEDGISESERNAAQALVDLGLTQASVVYILMVRTWLADGLDKEELAVVQSLESVARHHETAASSIVTMPFLRTVEEVDVFLLGEFEAEWDVLSFPVARDLADAISALAGESWVADGLNEHERAILERLKGTRDGFRVGYWREAFASLVSTLASESWIKDGIDELEWDLIEMFTFERPTSPAYIIKALVDEPWVQDGLDENERFLLHLRTGALPTQQAPAFVHFVNALAGEAWVQDGLDEQERYLFEQIRTYSSVFSEGSGASVTHFVNALAGEAWVQDGLDEQERYLLEQIRTYGSVFSEGSGASVTHFINALAVEPWLRDGLTTPERWLLSVFPWWDGSYRETDTAARLYAMNALLSEPWFQDGLNEAERYFARQIVRTPDIAATDALMHAGRALDAAWVKDGIDEDELLLVRQAVSANGIGAVLRSMADLSFRVIVEKRVITLPLSGEVPLVIIRSRPGSTRSMDGLEYAVRGVEALIGAPLPVPVVRLLLDPFRGGAGNAGDYIIMPAGTDGTDWLDGAIIHEMAHHYGRAGKGWVVEGAASIIEDIVAEPRGGKPVDAHNYPCAHAASIAELERDPLYGCNYTLGKRIFVDMYRTLGAELFRQGLGNLHSGEFGIHSFRTAFKSAAPAQADAVDAVVDRWYNGPQPRGVPLPDTGPVNPALEGVRGRVDAVDIVLRDGTSAVVVNAQKAAQGVWLRLEFAFEYVGAPRELTIKIEGHFEDGFTFLHVVRKFNIPSDSSELTEWQWLDIPTSNRDLVPGRYRVDVYHDDNKVAEAAFEVDLR